MLFTTRSMKKNSPIYQNHVLTTERKSDHERRLCTPNLETVQVKLFIKDEKFPYKMF